MLWSGVSWEDMPDKAGRMRQQLKFYQKDKSMNLLAFLKKVDTAADRLSKEQLAAFVHETARTLPESGRDDFLALLSDFEHADKAPESGEVRDDGFSELVSDIERICGKLTEIEDGERCLDSEYNEEWDEWYNSDVEEILFSDPEHLLGDVNEAGELVHRAVDMEAYQEGCRLAEQLSTLEVFATGDYDDYDGAPLGINDLYDHGLLDGSFEKLAAECLFLAYMGSDLPERAEKMFDMMQNLRCGKVGLETVLQTGNHDLPQFQEFLPLWIDYLGQRNSFGVKERLEEAQSMIADEEQLLEIARKFTDKHPELYLRLLQRGLQGDKNDRMFEAGMEALGRIPEVFTIRSEIALLTAEYACRMGDEAAAERCWKEAFRSDTSVINYMRIRFLSGDWEDHAEEIRDIYEKIYGSSSKRPETGIRYCDTEPLMQNGLHRNHYCMLLFFDREFDRVRKIGMNAKQALGWSSTFMKEGLAAFMLLLFEGDHLSKGLSSMRNIVQFECRFHAEEFLKGTGQKPDGSDDELFWRLFCAWKKEVTVPEEVKEQWLMQIEKLISFRVSGIMDANRRNYYRECAAFVAAFGEVQESLGNPNAREILMQTYKKKYSRRRAFHQELKAFGMRG